MNLLTSSISPATATNFPEKLLWKDGSITDMIVTSFNMKRETPVVGTMAGSTSIKLNLDAIVTQSSGITITPQNTFSLTNKDLQSDFTSTATVLGSAISNAQKLTKLRTQIHTMYRVVRNYFEPLGFEVGICGGSIRDVLRFKKMPKDIDIYLLADERGDLMDEDILSEHIRALFRDVPMEEAMLSPMKLTKRMNQLLQQNTEHYGDKAPIMPECWFKFEDIAPELAFSEGEELPCQIMRRSKKNSVKDFFALIDSFDWNICQYGLFDDKWFDLDMSDGPQDKLKYNKKAIGPSTALYSLKRGFLFCERFGMQIDADSIHFLCDYIAKQQIVLGTFIVQK